MGRYLERAQHLCRLLRLQTESLVDRPVREIYFGWRRIYASMDRQPPGGRLELDYDDDFTLADSYTLADDLTFERSNPDSVWSCFALGRENARQVRHCISAEMWISLNLAYLRIQKLAYGTSGQPHRRASTRRRQRRSIPFPAWPGQPCTATMAGASCSSGTSSNAPSSRPLSSWPTSPSQRRPEMTPTTTGQVYCDATTPSRRTAARYSLEVYPGQVLDLLVTDPLLPSSLCRSFDSAAEELAGLAPGPDADSSAATVGWRGGWERWSITIGRTGRTARSSCGRWASTVGSSTTW